MNIKRLVINIILLFGLTLAIFVLLKTLNKNELNTVAGSLAVITAIISSWSAQRIIWKQETELEPKLNVCLDIESRRDITQFVIENIGGSTAYDIKIIWTTPLQNQINEDIHFNSGVTGIDYKRTEIFLFC